MLRRVIAVAVIVAAAIPGQGRRVEIAVIVAFAVIDGDVARYAEEDFLADLLDVAVKSIRSAADEVDDAFGDVVRRRFEVDDDGLRLPFVESEEDA